MKKKLIVKVEIEANFDQDSKDKCIKNIERYFNRCNNKTCVISSEGFSWKLAPKNANVIIVESNKC